MAPLLLLAALVWGCASADMATSAMPGGGEDTWVYSGQGTATTDDVGQATLLTDASKAGDTAPPGDVDDNGSSKTENIQPSMGLVLPGAQNIAKFRELVAQGQVPLASDFPMEGWFNEVGSPLPAADAARPVDLHALGAIVAEPGNPPTILLQLGFNTAKNLADLQPALGLVVLVDTSGSMDAERLAAVRQGILALSDNLPTGSYLAVLGFSSEVQQLWAAAEWQPAARTELDAALAGLKGSGGTDLYVAFEGAAAVPASMPKSIKQQRVLLCSDGSSTQGGHSPAELVAQVDKLGLSLSAIGVGPQPRTGLLNALAKTGNGTYYEAPQLAAIAKAFTVDLQTLLVPVAQNLRVQVKLAAGWQIANAYGLPFKQQGSTMILGEADSQTGASDVGSGTADVSSAPDAITAQDGTSPVAPALASTLYPSQHNGMVVLRLAPPAGTVVDQALQLDLATVQWQYQLTASGQSFSHDTKVLVKGLVQIPDGALEFFSQPIARRTAALVLLGEAMRKACGQAHGQATTAEALATLEAAKTFAKRMLDAITPANDDPQGSLSDAVALAAQLYNNISAKP
ncbi:MAG: VWA domain-containing protein [Deltaproteobacteria bacterium]|nr:VWA domain-containing protein [Deltaproteobacteria bacterium]